MMAIDPPPPDLDERQAAFMRARGFVWNEKSRAWARGDPASAQRLECRSSARVLRWEGDHASAPPAVRTATRRFERQLRDAREEAIGDSTQDRKITLEIKDRIASRWAPFAWALAQAAVCALLLLALPPALDVTARATADAAAPAPSWLPFVVGVAFAPFLSALRRERWLRQRGIEDSDGQLERLLVDAQFGSYALPAPWEWRASELRWRVACAAAEGFASTNSALLWHGCVQARVVAAAADAAGDAAAADAIGATLGIVAVGASAVLRALYFYDDAVDGIAAECAAAQTAARRADVYYTMTAPDAEAATHAVRATSAMADEWERAFGAAADAKPALLALAFASAATGAVVWELSGRSWIGPAVALASVAVDTYVLRPDAELTRATVRLASVVEEGDSDRPDPGPTVGAGA